MSDMHHMRTALGLISVAGLASGVVAVDIPDNIPAYIGEGLIVHYPMDNSNERPPGAFGTSFIGQVFGNSEIVNFGRGGEFGFNLRVDTDANTDFLQEGPNRVNGRFRFGLEFTGAAPGGLAEQLVASGTDNNGEVPGLRGGDPRTVSFWMLPSVNELSANEAIPDSSCFINLGVIGTGPGQNFAIELDENDDLELSVEGARSNGFGGTRPVDFAQRAIDGEWTLVTIVVPDVSDPSIIDKGEPGVSLHDVILYADGQVWDLGDTGNDDVVLNTNFDRLWVGARGGGRAAPYEGAIDDIAVWNQGLSQQEVETLFAVSGGALQYNAGEFELLRQVHDGEIESARIGSLRWTRATGLSGNRVGGIAPSFAVIFDTAAGTGVTSAIAPDGLLVHYSFDLGTTGDAILVNEGLTGAQNDGVNIRNNDPEEFIYTPGFLGQALDGVDPNNPGLNQNNNSHVTQAGLTPITANQERTTSVWIKSEATEFDVPLTFGTNSPVSGTKWDIALDPNAGVTDVSLGGGNARLGRNGLYTGPDVRDGQWRNITAVLPTGATTFGEVTIYVDGVPVLGDPSNTSIVQTGPFQGWLYLMRSANHDGNGDAPGAEDGGLGGASNGTDKYTGALDDVAIWNVGFSGDEVRGLFDSANGLGYNAGKFDDLRRVHDAAGSGFAIIDRLRWEFATGLTGPAGLSGAGISFELVLDDASDTGVVSSCGSNVNADSTSDWLDLRDFLVDTDLDFNCDGVARDALDVIDFVNALQTNCGTN